MRRVAWGAALLAAAAGAVVLIPRVAQSQPRAAADRYDDAFRKYAKRYFGPAFDWRLFKAQGMAESNLDPKAKSWVGARGVMQLMPATFQQVASHNPELKAIDDPQMNIAAGIAYDRDLWVRWEGDSISDALPSFVFGSYNAGRRTLLNAQAQAREARLDPRRWSDIEVIAPKVKNWRHAETLEYVRRIQSFHRALDDRGRLVTDSTTARGLRR